MGMIVRRPRWLQGLYRRHFFALEAIFLALLAVTSISSCPRKCQCIWRDSKITVDCSDQELAAIPTTVEANTQVLNISGNNVPLFGRRHFARLGLTNLQRVAASRCGLVQIDSLAFVSLTNLVELDLSLNDLSEVPSDALNNGDGAGVSLMSLSLSSNKIEAIRTRALHGLGQLTKLDLSGNRISAVEAGAFEGLDSLQRIYLHSNRLTTLSARDLPVSLHGISVHENRWTCDCRLRSFRLWLTQSNVPRIVEPSCQGPRRLVGIHIQSLSLAEFACAPQLSPTSMYLTVPKGKNVSIVCRVASDPVSTITWFFNGQQIHSSDTDASHLQNIYYPRTSESLPPDYNLPTPDKDTRLQHHEKLQRIRVIRHDDVTGTGESRSELLIQQTNAHDNGTYYCQAENKAARSVSNFTLHVTNSVDSPTILQLRLEYFIAVAVAVIVILILVLIVVAVLLVRVCKHRAIGSSSSFSDKITSVNGSMTALQSPYGAQVAVPGATMVSNGKVAPVPSKMPKHIQMGTGFRTIPQQQQKPDLLTEAAHNLSRNSVNTTTTTSVGKPDGSTATSSSNHSHGSYKMAMENIIEDYGRRGSSRKPGGPLQSQQITNGNSLIGGSSLGHSRTNIRLQPHSQHHQELPLAVASLQLVSSVEYPSDYGLPPLQSGGGGSNNTGNGNNISPLPRCYSSLQPNLFPALYNSSNGGGGGGSTLRKGNGNHMLLPADEQYPTLPSSFRSPYIHTADSGPSAIVYYPSKAAHPIYEDIYSQVNKSGKHNKMVMAKQPNNCDTTDSAALERLSQLLTTTTDGASEVSADLIALHDKEAPMASQEESLGEAGTNSTTSEATDPNKSNVFQELDDAFTTLDQQELDHCAADAKNNIIDNSAGIRTQDPSFGVLATSSAISGNAFATNNDYEQNQSELIVSAPTPI